MCSWLTFRWVCLRSQARGSDLRVHFKNTREVTTLPQYQTQHSQQTACGRQT